MVSSETARFNTMRQLTFLLSALQGLLPTWSEALLLCPLRPCRLEVWPLIPKG
jgi:hypothetical protein